MNFQECLTNWVKVKNKICLALQVDDLQMSKFLKNGFKSGPRRKVDMEQFFSRVSMRLQLKGITFIEA